MKLNKLLPILFFLTLISCEQSIDSNQIERKNGHYYNKKTAKLLNGSYKRITPIGGTYNGNHVSTFEYDKGIPVGEWTYTFNGDPIHSGKYLDESELKEKINSLTMAQRTDLNLWEEGGYWMLNIELLFPENKDSIVMSNLIKVTNNAILDKYNYKSIDVFVVDDSMKEKVYWEKVK